MNSESNKTARNYTGKLKTKPTAQEMNLQTEPSNKLNRNYYIKFVTNQHGLIA